MDYTIVTSSSIDALPSAVKRHLAQGWEPLGPPFMLHSVGYYGQAVTRRTQRTLHDFAQSSSSNQTVTQQPPSTDITLSPDDMKLFNALKEKRTHLAAGIGAPAYCIASNKTLLKLVELKPKTLDELRAVYGFGPQRVEHYGAEFLSVFTS
jgi:ATP-dependent DNA helicase RecQ